MALLLSACSKTPLHLQDVENRHESYTLIVRSVVSDFIREAGDTYGVYCCGDGGSMPYDVEDISLFLQINERGNIDAARKLQLELSQLLLNKINSSEPLRPYLREYPFTAKRVGIYLSYEIEADKFASSNLSRGKLFYKKLHPIEQTYIRIHEETYEEAERIVAEQEAGQENTGLEIL